MANYTLIKHPLPNREYTIILIPIDCLASESVDLAIDDPLNYILASYRLKPMIQKVT